MYQREPSACHLACLRASLAESGLRRPWAQGLGFEFRVPCLADVLAHPSL